MDSFLWGVETLAAVQILFLANVLWSIFKGERPSGITSELPVARKEPDEAPKLFRAPL
jgi:hypothetical protein